MHVDTDLSAFLDGELAPAERARVDAHLDACPRCRGRLAELRATASLISALDSPRPARSLVPRVVERLNWLRPLRSFSAFATGGFLFVFLVTAIGRSGSGLGGGPEVPFGRSTTAAAPAAAPAAATAVPTPLQLPAPAAAGAAATPPLTLDAARTAASPTPRAETAFQTTPKAAADPAATAAPGAATREASQAESARDVSRTPPPLTDPLIWLGLAVIAAIVAIGAHWRLRTT